MYAIVHTYSIACYLSKATETSNYRVEQNRDDYFS